MGLNEKIKSIPKDKVKSVIGFIVFMALILKVFCNVTYLFRNVTTDTWRIAGIKHENVDMVYIGGSAAYCYWEPLKAWNDCGITSYLYATAGIEAEAIKAYMKEVRRTQEPQLYVVDVRTFQYYYGDGGAEWGTRNSTDNLELTSSARYGMLKEYFATREFKEDPDRLSYYLSIIKYHTNTENLHSSLAWELMDNDKVFPAKGWEWREAYGYVEEPQGFETDIRADLLRNGKKVLIDLLDYCKDKQLNVLFVVCPYYITEEEQQKYNLIRDTVKEYGFDFLNANECYDEIGIDFSTDFYNRNHVNLFGAKKYTEFLEKYIMDNYDLPDHRGDDHYVSWDEEYLKSLEDENLCSETVTNLRLDVEKGVTMAEQMRETQNFSEWYTLAEDDRYTLLIAAGDSINWPQNIAEQRIMESWGLNKESCRQIRVVNGGNVVHSNEVNQDLSRDGVIGIWEDIPYHISVEEGEVSILVNEEEVLSEQSDINVVVFDNNYRRVVDVVSLGNGEDGKICFYRK